MCTENLMVQNTVLQVAYEGSISESISHSPIIKCVSIQSIVLVSKPLSAVICISLLIATLLALKVCFINWWLWLLFDWHSACPKVDLIWIGKKNQGDSCSEDSPVRTPSSLCACVYGWDSSIQMCVTSIYEHMTPCLTSCQHPLACACVEACNSLLPAILKVQRCHIMFSTSMHLPLISTPCWTTSQTSTVIHVHFHLHTHQKHIPHGTSC